MTAKKKAAEQNEELKKEEVTEAAEATDVQVEALAEAKGKAVKEETVEDVVSEAGEAMRSQARNEEVTAEDAEKFIRESEEEFDFFRRSIVVPETKRGRNKMMAKLFDENIIGDEDGDVETEKRQRQREYDIMAASVKVKPALPLTGRVIGVEKVQYGSMSTYEAIVSLITDPKDPKTREMIKERREPVSAYKIHIPAPQFFFYYNAKDYDKPEDMRWLKKQMESRIGAIVDFVVYSIAPDDINVLASRIRAMQLISHRYYLGPRKQVQAGSICKGRVVSVGTSGIICEVLGAEVSIAAKDLSWTRMIAASDEFKVGDLVPVMVKSFGTTSTNLYGREFGYVQIEASVKDARASRENAILSDKYLVGNIYTGTITGRKPAYLTIT